MSETGSPPSSPPTNNTSPTIPAGAKRAFVTSIAFMGNLAGAVSGTSAKGSAAGDALCQEVADAAELGGAYQAYLGDATSDPQSHVTGSGPWYSTNGVRLFNNKANLATKPLAPFDTDERGETLVAKSYSDVVIAWTGAAGGLCDDWSSASGSTDPYVGIVGAEDQTWRLAYTLPGYSTTRSCAAQAHLYCFEK